LSAANSQEIARALPSSSAGSSASLRRSDVEHDRSGLEQHEAVVFEERHLPEGLARAVVGGRLVVGVDQPRAVSEAASSSARRTRRSRTWPCANGGTHLKAEMVIMAVLSLC
jgi:hypothetical protein